MSRVQNRSRHLTWTLCARLLLFVLAIGSFDARGAQTIAAGRFHGLWVKDDGTVAAWGFNGLGQVGDGTYTDRSFPVPTSGLTGVKAATGGAAGGLFHSLAVKTDGTVWAWGANSAGQLGDGSVTPRTQPLQVAGLTGVAAVSAGDNHSLARKTDGTVWAWGRNDYGQLGDGTTTDRIVPVRVAGLSGVISVAGGHIHSIALKGDGTVWAWGNNDFGQIGDGTATGRKVPVQVAGLTGVVEISTIADHSIARKSDGTVWAWGYNYYGGLGDGTTITRSLPVRVTGLVGVAQVVAGGTASYARKLDGTVVAWGDNYFGQLGDGTTTERHAPVAVQGMTGATLITAGSSHAAMLRGDGSVWSVGQNVIGQLGDGSIVQAPAPVPLSGLTGVSRLAPGYRHSLALRTNGTVVAWGENFNGELGDGTAVSRGSPTPVAGLTNVAAIAAGTGYSMALKADGTVWTWGDNSSGQLGDPASPGRAIPGQIPGLGNVVAIAAGVFHAIALKSDGSLWAWGGNTYGQLGDGTTTTRGAPVRVLSVASPAAIAAGGHHTLILRTDGTVAAWGRNDAGQLGDGTRVNRSGPVTVSGLTGVTAISGGNWHALALKSDGTVWGWGLNNTGALGTGTHLNSSVPAQAVGAAGVIAISAGGRQSMALTTDGSVLAWGGGGTVGDGTDRDTLYPTALSFIGAVDRIVAGFDFTLALTHAQTVVGWGSNYSQKLGIPFPDQSAAIVKLRDPLAAFAGSDLVVEFFNPTIRNADNNLDIGHYFLTAVPAEATSIDNGGSGAGWRRTGRTFRAWRPENRAYAPAGAVPVCRFYGPGPNSHFYTSIAAECQNLRDHPGLGWNFEEISFYTVPPAGAACPAGYYPIYRSYNNRFAFNHSNHRMTPSYIDWQRSIAFLGYADEGVSFCSPAATDTVADLHAWHVYPGAEVAGGSQMEALFVFTNNGPGPGNGGRVYMSLPPEVSNWSFTCFISAGTDCPASSDLTTLRSGQVIGSWPPGGVMVIKAIGTVPQLTAGGNATLKYAALATNGTGTPDANRANNAPPNARTLVKSPQACNFAVNPTSLSLGTLSLSTPALGAQIAVLAGAGCNWTVQNSVPWLAASASGGSGNGSVILTPQANTAVAARSATLVIAGQTIAVTQAGVACTYTANPPSLTLGAGAQSVAVALTGVAGCAWNAQSSAPSWLAVAPPAGNSGLTLTISLVANSSAAARTGAITVGSLTIPVAQAGAAEVAPDPPPPSDPCATFRLQRDGDQMSADGLSGEGSVAVLADTVCRWSSRSDAQWLSVTAGGSGVGNGTIKYAVQPNADPQVRIGAISTAGKSFTVTQQGSANSNSSGSDGGSDSSGGGGGDGGGSGGDGGSSGGSSG